MNERLKQFADQCRGNPMTSAFEPRFDKEKFAELIVRECSGFVYNYPEKYLTRNQAREISLSMEEHFGVKE